MVLPCLWFVSVTIMYVKFVAVHFSLVPSSVPWHGPTPTYLFTYQCSLGYLLTWPVLSFAAVHILVQILETFLKVYFCGKICTSVMLAICKCMIQWHETHKSCVNVR